MHCAVSALQIIYSNIRYAKCYWILNKYCSFSNNYKLACLGKPTAKDDSVILGMTTVARGITKVNAIIIALGTVIFVHVWYFWFPHVIFTRTIHFIVTVLTNFILLDYILKLIKLPLVRNLYSTEVWHSGSESSLKAKKTWDSSKEGKLSRFRTHPGVQWLRGWTRHNSLEA